MKTCSRGSSFSLGLYQNLFARRSAYLKCLGKSKGGRANRPGEPGFDTAPAGVRGKLSRGFTMLELLLVVAIMLVAAGLSIPSFMRSFRGAKLRTSARTVVMSHRYARAMAVLKQTEVAILFDTKKNELEIVSVASATPESRSKFLDGRVERTGVQRVDQKAAPAPSGGISTEQIRAIEEGVRIARFDNPGGEREKDGIFWVRYYSSGMCDAYTVRLVDEYNKSASVKVDSISGKAMVEYE